MRNQQGDLFSSVTHAPCVSFGRSREFLNAQTLIITRKKPKIYIFIWKIRVLRRSSI